MTKKQAGGERLWDKGGKLDKVIHRFTVGQDPELDLQLLPFDAIGSAAHARMLARIGVLSSGELQSLLKALSEVHQQSRAGKFEIPLELEDGHTAIEAFLTKTCGDAGAKIHTGRSRNDQVILAMRLLLRDRVLVEIGQLIEFAKACANRISSDGALPMPGYTHMQPAMPSCVGIWLHSYLEWALELVHDGFRVFDALDSNPLGSASGFGVPLPLDRDYVRELLAFSRVQRSVMAVQNSRGRSELRVVRWLNDVASMVEKLSVDLGIFLTSEYGFVGLPEGFTTGSSIMPQKRNPDVVELLRGVASRVRGAEQELQGVIAKLPSSYHRDLQHTKEPTLRAIADMQAALPIASAVVLAVAFNQGRLEAAMVPELWATYDAYLEVEQGMPFREAYKLTANRVAEGKLDLAKLKPEFSKIRLSYEAEVAEATDELALLTRAHEAKGQTLAKVEQEIFSPTGPQSM